MNALDLAAASVLAGEVSPTRQRQLVDRRGLTAAAQSLWRAGRVDRNAVAQVLRHRRTRVYVESTAASPLRYPPTDQPVALLAEGDRPEAFDAPRVAIVGTRAATVHGLDDAFELGRVLAAAGVTIVSGLAIGIDAAAHRGAIEGGGLTVGVVATGLDVVYPRRHRALFDEVRRAGLLVGETWFGVQPLTWRFPVRNRIIAALADVVVVVEATATGGARITAERAAEYGRPVLAIPGSRRNPAAAGTNALIADGAHPLLEPDDVLLALGLERGGQAWNAMGPPPPGAPRRVFDACAGEAATVDELVTRTGLDLAAVTSALGELRRGSWVRRDRGCWWPT